MTCDECSEPFRIMQTLRDPRGGHVRTRRWCLQHSPYAVYPRTLPPLPDGAVYVEKVDIVEPEYFAEAAKLWGK